MSPATTFGRKSAIFAAAAALVAGTALTAPAPTHALAQSGPAATVSQHSTTVLPNFAAITERYGTAVVNVRVSGKSTKASRSSGKPGANGIPPEWLERFGIPPGNADPRKRAPRSSGQGSGFIISADGMILTNAHVVGDAQEVTVRMTDRREYPAKVLGLDKRTDVAVLKIEASNLPTVKLGDPASIKAGQWVLAIGSPFGFENTVTVGVVSATGRNLPSDAMVPFIQTDVAVKSWQPGGPLFNTAGEVIGINSQIFSRTVVTREYRFDSNRSGDPDSRPDHQTRKRSARTTWRNDPASGSETG